MSLMLPKRPLPSFLQNSISQEDYARWLDRKAEAHLRRDKSRSFASASRPTYKDAIHAAVETSKGLDYYTGEKLNWTLISTYKNEESKVGGHGYKEGFALLPTVDHVEAHSKQASFVICGWRTNSAKNDLSIDAFLELCEKVLKHAKLLK